MEKKHIAEVIGHIEASLAILKKELGVPTSDATPSKASVAIKSRSGAKRNGSTEPIKKLIDEGFFNSPKSAPEVKAALTRKALKFNKNDLAVTMMRLVRSELLARVDGDGTKVSPWLYKKT